eukprot:TRINITY_DN20756_c0_g1_i1.p1 TRINITY_DN20756_c0_g1~~TRINITY_DN20756_c0_g1_i1.p1  ORF type:complete len:351 (+),score=65.13 TRINITY_DN20756_c0_g1_i1:142-1194(+)
MGHVLAQPITDKESGDGGDPSKSLAWGYSCMQGWRISMEDAHFTIAEIAGVPDTAIFGVMDGHGGDHVARFCKHNLPAEISEIATNSAHKDVSSILIDSFHRMDEMLLEQAEKGWGRSSTWVGCTANVCLVGPEQIVVANAGDSRAVLCRHGQAVPLSEDHKPNLPGELQRISNAGGTVERQQAGTIVQYRVNGNLNLSRSIGDLEYKKNADLGPAEQMICSTPDVSTFKREARDEFIVLCCDGVWDVMGNQDVVDFVRARLIGNSSVVLSKIAEELLDNCVSHDLSATGGLGGDNMTAVIVVFRQGQQGLAKSITAAHPQPISSEVGGSSAALDDRVVAPSGLCSCKMV